MTDEIQLDNGFRARRLSSGIVEIRVTNQRDGTTIRRALIEPADWAALVATFKRDPA